MRATTNLGVAGKLRAYLGGCDLQEFNGVVRQHDPAFPSGCTDARDAEHARRVLIDRDADAYCRFRGGGEYHDDGAGERP
jgi:hypothetical protein